MTRRDARFDVIVVLGGPRAIMRHRAAQAIRLHAAGRADFLLLSGRAEAEAMRDQALAAGVARERLVLEPDSRSTLENALFSARVMRERGWRRALVVTDSLHLPRALLAFRSAGIAARGRAAPWPWREAPVRIWLLHALHEALGLGWYLVLILSGRTRRSAEPHAPSAKS